MTTPVEPEYPIEVVTTAYTIGDGYTPSNICADGSIPVVGTVAYNGVPLGTKIYIDNQEYTVRDRTLHDGVVDIYMNDLDSALEYGIQRKTIIIGE